MATTIKVAHVLLRHYKMVFVRTFPHASPGRPRQPNLPLQACPKSRDKDARGTPVSAAASILYMIDFDAAAGRQVHQATWKNEKSL